MQIRPLTTIDDCRLVALLEREIWGYVDAEDVVPPAVLVVSVKRGGILLGAFDAAGTMGGFVSSVPGVKGREVTQWSHLLGVAPAARHTGLGGRLKLAQRDAALEMGVELVEWTYDPLQALNAHLNFAKLGVVAEQYRGEPLWQLEQSASPRHADGSADRRMASGSTACRAANRAMGEAGRTRSVSGRFGAAEPFGGARSVLVARRVRPFG